MAEVWQAHSGLKRMKAFLSEVVNLQATAITLFGVGMWIMSQDKFDSTGIVPIITQLYCWFL